MDSNENPTTSVPPPPTESGNSLPLILFLVVAILAGGGAFYYQFQRQASREQQSGMPGPPVTASAALEFSHEPDAQGLLETFGDGDSVLVYVSDPGSPCQQAARETLRALVKEHPGVIKVSVYQMGSLAATERTGQTCAGYAVYKKVGDVETMFKYFGKSPSAGGWTAADLRAAVEAAIAELEEAGALGAESGESAAESGVTEPETAEPPADQIPTA